MEDIAHFYNWSQPTAARYFRELVEQGYVTIARSGSPFHGNFKQSYHFHEDPVPPHQRTARKNKGAPVTSRIDTDVIEERLRQKHEELAGFNRPEEPENATESFGPLTGETNQVAMPFVSVLEQAAMAYAWEEDNNDLRAFVRWYKERNA